MPLSLHKLNLSRFRSYDALRLVPAGAPLVILTGANGAGKTNLLEAVSLLAPGKGLRGADLAEIQSRDDKESWAVAAEIETPSGLMARVGTGLGAKPGGETLRRTVRLDGKDLKSQNDLASVVSAVWLTPQMDRIFQEGPAPRRKFLDRLVYAVEPEHAGRVAKHDKNVRERMRLLQAGPRPDAQWLSALEKQIAGDAVAIAAARLHVLSRLQAHAVAQAEAQPLFPLPRMELAGIESRLSSAPAVELEETLARDLQASRAQDAATGRTGLGAHRSDFTVVYAEKDMPAAQCSTGEQKALLVSIVLAHAAMMKAEKGHAPLLLLDEVVAHLDEDRRAQLFGFLEKAGGQAWLTGTDRDVFAPLKGRGLFYSVGGGQVRAEPKLEAV